jgi:beta-lactam-binding protein with PASTA domain
MVTVPNVVGQTQTAATNVIIATNLTVGTISNQFSQTVPAGSVISQNPLAGTQVAAGSAVSLLVSLGPQMITVPDVVGQTQNAATNAIIATNLVVGTVSNQFNAIVPPGLVMGQEPAGGLEVSAGSTVNLVVSSGPLLLQLTQSADQLVLSWPTAAVGFNLVFNTDLVSTNWTLVSPSPVIEGENLVVTNQLADPVGFYRLQQ